MKNEIIIYRPNELAEHIEVRMENETVWLNRNQLALLFGRDVKTIGKHINNIFIEKELDAVSSVANFAIDQSESGRRAKRITYHEIDRALLF
jgi:hypothetical protein